MSSAAIDAPLGVFDSGLGGLTVVAELSRALPDEQIYYLGDTARVPYGTKSAATVIRYSIQIADFLTVHSIKYLVVACNTASAHALGALQQHVTIPVMGVVEPGAALAASRTKAGEIGVIGTLGTIGSGAYRAALQRHRPDLIVFSQPCPLLVPLAEEGWSDHPVTAEIARHYLGELRHQGDLDTIVLGCTHYPLLTRTLADAASTVFGHPVDLIDSASAVARAVADDLGQRQLLAPPGNRTGADRFFVTDDSRFDELAPRFLGSRPARAEHADL